MLKISDLYQPIGKKVLYVHTFEPKKSNELGVSDFSAYYAAEKWLKDLGYITGSMERYYPIGFSPRKEWDYISKWNNMNSEERKQLHGVILCGDRGFREDKVHVVFCESPLKALVKHVEFKKIKI
jgi:hypothetical protein